MEWHDQDGWWGDALYQRQRNGADKDVWWYGQKAWLLLFSWSS